ncbi:MAG: hypothetical protein IPJ97_06250 [Proteobacteria bacterium]|nr:hypothetical protein [Pseudomonadota bacterium]
MRWMLACFAMGLGFAVPAVAAETVAAKSQVDLMAVAQSISDTLRAHVYDPAVLNSDRYATAERETEKLAAQATSSDDSSRSSTTFGSKDPSRTCG